MAERKLDNVIFLLLQGLRERLRRLSRKIDEVREFCKAGFDESMLEEEEEEEGIEKDYASLTENLEAAAEGILR